MKGVIVLIHGLFMRAIVMDYLRINLQKKGYHVIAFSYQSVQNSMPDHLQNLAKFIELHKNSHKYAHLPLHFVGHSLGGLLIRLFYEQYPQFFTGGIITLGTPHKGSYVAHILQKNKLSKKLLAQVYPQALDGQLPLWQGKIALGSIAGTRALGIGSLFNLPKPNDGTVLESETKLDNMQAHISLNCTHMGLIYSSKVCDKIDIFLQYSHF